MHHGGKYWILMNDFMVHHKHSFCTFSNHVYFFSGHCKKLTPEYEQAAETLAKNDPPFFVAKVDATEQKKVAEEFGVQGFPTLKWFK
jgi:hypothetical protein